MSDCIVRNTHKILAAESKIYYTVDSKNYLVFDGKSTYSMQGISKVWKQLNKRH